jgi:hypothetical protein
MEVLQATHVFLCLLLLQLLPYELDEASGWGLDLEALTRQVTAARAEGYSIRWGALLLLLLQFCCCGLLLRSSCCCYHVCVLLLQQHRVSKDMNTL